MTILEEIEADLKRQAEAGTSELFTKVERIREHIRDAVLPKKNKDIEGYRQCWISAEMGVYDVTPFDRGWRVRLVDKDLQACYQHVKKKLDALTDSLKKKYCFVLTVWHSSKRKRGYPVKMYVPGQTYAIKKVRSLDIYNNTPQGAINADVLIDENEASCDEDSVSKRMKVA